MSFDSPRVINAQDLRAMSHPLRVRLLDLLQQEGQLTATEAAARLETTPANCSFHLRLLARHGFVEEAAGGVGRQRPWQRVERVIKISSDEFGPEDKVVLRALDELELEQYRETHVKYRETRDQYPEEWRQASARIGLTAHLTAEELAEMKAKLIAVLDHYDDLGRPSRRRPGTTPVNTYLSLIPVRPPEATDD